MQRSLAVLRVFNGTVLGNFPSSDIGVGGDFADGFFAGGIVHEKDPAGPVDEFYVQGGGFVVGDLFADGANVHSKNLEDFRSGGCATAPARWRRRCS